MPATSQTRDTQANTPLCKLVSSQAPGYCKNHKYTCAEVGGMHDVAG